MTTPESASYLAAYRCSDDAAHSPESLREEHLAALDLATGQEACERLLSIDGLPPQVDLETRRRMAALAPALAAVAPSTRYRPVPIRLPGGWAVHGASLALAPDGLHLLVQSGNFTRRLDGDRAIHDDRGIARGRNYWAALDDRFALREFRAIHTHGLQPGDIAVPLSGLLHGRPFQHDGSWWIVSAIGDAEAGQAPVPLLARLDGDWLRDTTVLRRHAGPDPRWNPMPSAPGAPPLFLTSVFPTVVWRMHEASRSAYPQTQLPAPLIARRLVGTTHGIPHKGGCLSLAIERVSREDGRVQTVHRWLWFDENCSLSRLSRPFLLSEGGFEHAAGLVRRGNEIVFSACVADGQVIVGTVSAAEVSRLLAPPLDLDLEPIERQLEEEQAAKSRVSTIDAPRAGTRLNRAHRPAIASMTITGSNRDIVADALRSVVDWVDWCILIDTGIEDDTIEIARGVAGDKLIVREFPWIHDFSAARNFALAAAAETGATWAVFVDSDERLVLNGVDIHAVLASSPELSLLVPHSSGEYTKDRFFRLPVTGEFRGPTHEAFYVTFDIGGGTVTIPGVVFEELLKSPEKLRLKDERDRDMLRRYTQQIPDQPRWFYYLGDVLARLGQHEEAVAAFRSCYALRGWDEEGAWAMYRATQCLIELGRLEDALETIVLGMARHAALADFPWFAAWISLRLGRSQQAVYWARRSIDLGYFAGIGPTVLRTGWRYPFALWEGPYDVLRFALKELGDDRGAAEAERLFAEAAAARAAQPGQGAASS